jgi:hypothetical protein
VDLRSRPGDGDAVTPGADTGSRSLAAKLGIADSMAVALVGGPPGIEGLLEPLPPRVTLQRSLGRGRKVDLIVCFATRCRDLERRLDGLLEVLGDDGVLWVAWPKKAFGVPTDLSDEVVRTSVLPTGWVDTKVCAIDATWSGLKFVRRKERRGGSQEKRSAGTAQRRRS